VLHCSAVLGWHLWGGRRLLQSPWSAPVLLLWLMFTGMSPAVVTCAGERLLASNFSSGLRNSPVQHLLKSAAAVLLLPHLIEYMH